MFDWFRKYIRKIGIFGVEVEFQPPTDTSSLKPELATASVPQKAWEGSTPKPPPDPLEKKPSVGETLESLEKVQDMMTVAASACNLTAKKSRGQQYLGVKLDEKYYVCVSFKEPNKLWFATMRRIDPSAAARLGVGEVWQETWIPGRNRWGRSADLNLESVQMDWLVKFLNECLAQARCIETEEVEGS